MLDERPPRRRPTRRTSSGDALELPFEDGAFERVFTGHFYGHLEAPERERFSARPGGSPRARDRRLGAPTGRPREEWQERILNDGSRWQVFKRFFEPEALAAELGGGDDASSPGRWFVAVRCLTRRRSRYRSIASLQRDNRRLPRAAPRPGFPLESLPVVSGCAASARTCSGRRRGSSRARSAALARPRRADAAPLAPARRGRVLRDLLLRLGHALLPGPAPRGPRRPDADAARAGALLVLARMGASPPAPRARRHRRRPRSSPAARPDER